MTTSSSTLRVRYAETDQMGVAYHGSLLPWFEVGRTDWLRGTGLSYAEIEAKWELHLAVVEATLRYEKRIGYDEEITIETTPLDLGAARISFKYRLLRNGQQVATGKTLHACVDSQGRPKRWPDELRDQLAGLISTS